MSLQYASQGKLCLQFIEIYKALATLKKRKAELVAQKKLTSKEKRYHKNFTKISYTKDFSHYLIVT